MRVPVHMLRNAAIALVFAAGAAAPRAQERVSVFDVFETATLQEQPARKSDAAPPAPAPAESATLSPATAREALEIARRLLAEKRSLEAAARADDILARTRPGDAVHREALVVRAEAARDPGEAEEFLRRASDEATVAAAAFAKPDPVFEEHLTAEALRRHDEALRTTQASLGLLLLDVAEASAKRAKVPSIALKVALARARSLAAANRPNEALDMLSRHERITPLPEPPPAEWLSLRGALSYQLERAPEARRALQRLVEVYPDSPSAVANLPRLGLLHELAGDTASARRTYARALTAARRNAAAIESGSSAPPLYDSPTLQWLEKRDLALRFPVFPPPGGARLSAGQPTRTNTGVGSGSQPAESRSVPPSPPSTNRTIR